MARDRSEMIKDWKTFREYALELAHEGIIPIFGEFCPELEEIVLDALHLVRIRKQQEIIILINSTGGRNIVYTTIKNAMAMCNTKFMGIVLGKAFSNGFMLLQSCHKRVAMADTEMMFHWGSNTLSNNMLAALLAGDTWPIEQIKRDELQTAEFVSKRTNVSIGTLINFALYERMVKPQEALELGFIDEVMQELPNKVVLPSFM